MSTCILAADDDPSTTEILALLLESGGFEVGVCATGNNVLPLFRADRPGLVLPDVMLPGLDDVSVCRLIREESDMPVTTMGARTDSVDVVTGLEAGVDDYVTKPFENSMLLMKVKARLRRQEPEHEVLRVSDLTIDPKVHQVQRADKVLHLTPLEFKLSSVLARKPWQVFSREELLGQVRGYRQSSHNPYVANVHIQRLRPKVEHDPDRPEAVLTVRGVGYRVGVVRE